MKREREREKEREEERSDDGEQEIKLKRVCTLKFSCFDRTVQMGLAAFVRVCACTTIKHSCFLYHND